MAKVHRTRRRLIVPLILVMAYLAWTNPTPQRFEDYISKRYPVASFVHRRTPLKLTGSRDFVIFSVYGVQTVGARRHFGGVCGRFWEV